MTQGVLGVKRKVGASTLGLRVHTLVFWMGIFCLVLPLGAWDGSTGLVHSVLRV